MTQIVPIFHLIYRPHPKPHLFPYTTLFRSSGASTGGRTPQLTLRARTRRVTAPAGASPATGSSIDVSHPRRDRKSTRLNSSHLGISYAVFCLKKKKK